MKFASLRANIRHITDTASGLLWSKDIFPKLTRRCELSTFAVTLDQMCDAGQLIRKRTPGGGRSKFKYGSGPVPVNNDKEYRPERERLKGHMELAREARARGRA